MELKRVALAFRRRQAIPGLHDTITRLAALRRRPPAPNRAANDRLSQFDDFGSNPGSLLARAYIPGSLRAGAPLVVVLHGCTQTASSYDLGSGWSSLADEHGFALLFPEQQRLNNPNLCFNWFRPQDSSRGRGEALSIRQMVSAMHARHGTDRERVFITGLSAGGAMAAVMLATYPDVFAGGGIIAGLPFGTARSVPEAFERMRGQGEIDPDRLAGLVRSASSYAGPWPTLSVWHGSGDATVDISNAKAIVDQWRMLHGAARNPCRSGTVEGYPHHVWCDADGRDVIEEYIVTGMAHGTPLNTGDCLGEAAGPYMLDAGISSTRGIAQFWGITDGSVGSAKPSLVVAEPVRHRSATNSAEHSRGKGRKPAADGVQKTIEDALRAAGLLR
ncbi:MAG: extracellular catalytic domain type 1 short-chain-length polyhydroxyalkanoate depolymerase [Sphingomicrobium sp.]